MNNIRMKGSVLKDTTHENLVVAVNTRNSKKGAIQFERSFAPKYGLWEKQS